ncbi:MAG: T9SS type A sorting domain-containing protein [Saprospiraceae bacterium]
MKKFLLAIVVFPFLLQGQVTFNKRMRYDYSAAVLTGIIATDSFYYATSIIADTVFPYKTGTAFLKFTLDGELSDIKATLNTQKTYEAWFDNFLQLPDGGFATPGYSFDTTTSTILIRYTTEGDTLFTHSYFNPNAPTYTFIQPRGGMVTTSDGGFLLANAIGSNHSNAINYLIKTDSLGNIEWDYIYFDTKWNRPQSLIATPDGKFIVGSIKTNQNVTNSNYTFQCHIFQVDSLGNKEWEYLSPVSSGLRDSANDMILQDDGSLIVASGVGHEIESSSQNTVYFEKMVFKLSPSGELAWQVKFPDIDYDGYSRTTKLLKLSDGTGFLVAGMAYEALPYPKYFAVRGWLAKISYNGDIIWTRQHVYLDDGEDEHKIFDLKETNDGGFIVCGEAKDWASNSIYRQQAWLLKLDGYGCLVPDCQLLDNVVENYVTPIQLVIYPNPASDYLNFQLRNNKLLSNGQFRILDSNGRFIKSFPANSTVGDTFVIPVSDWATGIYFLQFLDLNEHIVAFEKFIVTH